MPAANLPAAEDAIPLAQKGQPNGVAALAADGKVPAAQLPPIESIPTGFVAWAPKRGGIWAGWIPGDGQLVSRATFPDLAAAVADGVVPVVSEAEWLADPLKRGAYTLGDGATSIRVPDYNGKSAGAIGAAFLRGDGALSVDNGAIKASQNKTHAHAFQSPQYLGSETGTASFLGATTTVTPVFPRYTTAEGGVEANPTFVSGCFIIKVFGAVSRPGSVDAAQLATRLAALDAAFQTDIDFKLLYPGGSATTPGVIYQNTVQTIDNPFPGSPVQVVVEHELNGQWFEPGWFCSTDRTGRPMIPFRMGPEGRPWPGDGQDHRAGRQERHSHGSRHCGWLLGRRLVAEPGQRALSSEGVEAQGQDRGVASTRCLCGSLLPHLLCNLFK